MANSEHERTFRESVRTGNFSVDMSGFDLSGLRLTSARLEGARLSKVDLRRSDLSGGYFRAADLSEAQLGRARIVVGDFRDAKLVAVDLTAADLNGSVLTGADLSNANLTRANFVKTRLDRVNLTGANLDCTDLRGVQGLTREQLDSAINGDKAILDPKILELMGRTADIAIARRGLPSKKKARPNRRDLRFASPKPCFGDLFLLCGCEHPDFPPTGSFGFDQVTDLGIEQVDDYFVICVDGDPVVWIYPLVGDRVVEHHSGPIDGLRVELADSAHTKRWKACLKRLQESIPFLPSE